HAKTFINLKKNRGVLQGTNPPSHFNLIIQDNFITWIHILRPDPPHAVPCEHLLLALPSKIRVHCEELTLPHISI
ncbi:putative protein lysine methyltransferase SET5, partial [Frankliniella fusca]